MILISNLFFQSNFFIFVRNYIFQTVDRTSAPVSAQMKPQASKADVLQIKCTKHSFPLKKKRLINTFHVHIVHVPSFKNYVPRSFSPEMKKTFIL